MAETALSKNNQYKRIPGTLLYTKSDEVKQQEKAEAEQNWEALKNAGKELGSSIVEPFQDVYNDFMAQDYPSVTRFMAENVVPKFLPTNVVFKKMYDWGDPGNWDSWMDRIKNEAPFHKKDKQGNMHLHVDSIPEVIAKFLFNEKPEQEILGLEDLEAGLEKYGDGAGSGAGGSNPISLPSIGSMPALPNVDWQAIRDRINNIDVDTNYEAPQRDPLVALGDFLANIDLTSNLSGDWSKASNKMVEFQKYNEEQEKAAKNKTADRKAELELWKAMKDVAIQEAAANHAMKNAEFGLRWQQAKMNAALQQAKANAFYNTSGPGSEYLDPAYREGRRIAAMTLMTNPELTEKDALNQLTKANLLFKRQPKQNPNFQLGYTDAFMEGIKELKERNK